MVEEYNGGFQSPQRGLFISYREPVRVALVEMEFQSPQRGLFISYVNTGADLPNYEKGSEFQSPQRGLFISYRVGYGSGVVAGDGVSVPSAGIVYFLLKKFVGVYIRFVTTFQSPQRGLFISYRSNSR